MNGDPRCPVITGSLYSKANPPPLPPTASNDQKAIVTHGKLRIDFFDKTGALEISTPGGRSLRFDDKAGTVTVKDASGNTVTMDKSGISIDSSTRISLTTKSDISMTAQGKLLLKGTHGVAIDGPVIPAKAATNINPQSPAKRG
jgi:uncharacterized protein involved in type VI secretion and phage assembly